MKVIYSEFDFNRKEEFQLIKKLYLDNDKVFWRVTPNKKSEDYFNSLKDLKNFPDAQILDIDNDHIDFEYELSFTEFNNSNTGEYFDEFIQRNFQVITADKHDFSGCPYLAGLQINLGTKLVLNSYLSLNPEQVCRIPSRIFLKSIYEFPCKAIPFDMLKQGIFSSGKIESQSGFSHLDKTPVYNMHRFDYFKKYQKKSVIFERNF